MPDQAASLKSGATRRGGPGGALPLRKLFPLALVALLLLESFFLARSWLQAHSLDLHLSRISPGAPRAWEIAEILKPLRYSGVSTLLRPEVRLSLDTRNRTWALTDFFRFDSLGRTLLEEDHSGACGLLAAAAYQRVRPLLDAGLYDIKFVRASESGFFLPPSGTHFLLRIMELGPPGIPGKVFILDPVFRRYGEIGEFTDYFFQEEMALLPFMELRSPHLALEAGVSIPLEIRGDRIVSLVVRDVNGKFDMENYSLNLRVRERHHFTGTKALQVRVTEGKREIIEDRPLALKALAGGRYGRLRERLIRLSETAQENVHDASHPLSWRSKQIGYSGPD